jgi:divalent metal cation (Fe/Co/Zn/Cd) transporter
MKELLVGEAATREDRSAIRAATLSVKEVSSIGRLLTMQLSPHEILVNMDVHLDDGLTTDEAEAVIDVVEAAIQQEVPEATRIFIELEPGR